MATANYYASGACQLMAEDATGNLEWVYTVGFQNLGMGKTKGRRAIQEYNLAAPSHEGITLSASDVITAAEFVFAPVTILGTGFNVRLSRVVRAAFDYTLATWQKYDGVNVWGTAGASHSSDISSTDEVIFAAPAVFGDYTVAGLGPLVIDAIANRAGRLMFRTADADGVESNPDNLYTPVDVGSSRPHVRVYYEVPAPSVIDHPEGSTLPGSRPASSSYPAPVGTPARPASPAKGH